MKRFVYNEKYAKLLVMMDGKTSKIDELAREIDANSGHLRTVLEQWHKEGVITKDKPGRDYEIQLTAKGSMLAAQFMRVMQLVDHFEDIEKEFEEEPESIAGDTKDAEARTSAPGLEGKWIKNAKGEDEFVPDAEELVDEEEDAKANAESQASEAALQAEQDAEEVALTKANKEAVDAAAAEATEAGTKGDEKDE